MEEQETARQAEPELLYHYTTEQGLLGILQDRCIWATHLQYLNDKSEGQIIPQLVLSELSERSYGMFSDSWKQFWGLTSLPANKMQCNDEGILSQGLGISSWITTQDVFVSSFSEKGNLLSQWRAYSGDGGGYSIGFSQDYLKSVGDYFLQTKPERIYSKSNPLVACRYCNEAEETSLKSEIDQIVSSYIAKAEEAKQYEESRELEGFNSPAAIALKYFLALGKLRAIVKDRAFYEEAEWRLVFQLNNTNSDSDMKFRVGHSMLVPYCNVDLTCGGQTPHICEIVVGPCPHPTEAMKSVQMLLRKEGIRNVVVKDSQIPYRNW
jgi:hypothetical protein